MITDNTLQILSSVLDMAHGILPSDMFGLTMVVRCKDENVPAHFLIGDDPEPVVAATLKRIAAGDAMIGMTNREETQQPIRMSPVIEPPADDDIVPFPIEPALDLVWVPKDQLKRLVGIVSEMLALGMTPGRIGFVREALAPIETLLRQDGGEEAEMPERMLPSGEVVNMKITDPLPATASCPICLKRNPCPTHSPEQQKKYLDGSEAA